MQGATEEASYSEGMCMNCSTEKTTFRRRSCTYWKTTDLKDDFVRSKDDIYIQRIEFLEDAESKDDFNI